MSIELRKYYFSYVFLGITIILFSISFINYENFLFPTIAFLLIVNVTCFTSEYFVVKYYQKNKQKKPSKGYILFVTSQLVYTIAMFIFFKTYLHLG